MKKTTVFFLIALKIFCLCGCSSSNNKVDKVRIMEESYFVDKTSIDDGNDVNKKDIYIKKIWMTTWLGTEKLVFDFYDKNDPTRTELIPTYQLESDLSINEVNIILYNMIEDTIDVATYSNSRFVREVIVKYEYPNYYVRVLLNEPSEVSIEEVNVSDQLVINFAQVP